MKIIKTETNRNGITGEFFLTVLFRDNTHGTLIAIISESGFIAVINPLDITQTFKAEEFDFSQLENK